MTRKLLLLMAFLLISSFAAAQQTPSMEISGRIITSKGVPIPGCEVLLINSGSAVGSPVETDDGGYFDFSSVPTTVTTLYNVQVHFGPEIIYQGPIAHPGPQPDIVIPVKQ